jgi:hypothetical protein
MESLSHVLAPGSGLAVDGSRIQIKDSFVMKFSETSFASRAIFATFVLAGTFGAGSVVAFCGLESCPRIDPHGQTHSTTAGARARVIGFDIGDESGYYGIVSPHLFVRIPFVSHLSVGAEVPWVSLHTADDDVSGLGNPLLTAQYARRLSHDWSAEAGLQLELPLGEADQGLADDHFMVLPWIGGRFEGGTAWYASGVLGYSQAVGGEEEAVDTSASARLAPLSKVAHNGVDHGAAVATPLLVNPHGDREVHWRAAVGYRPRERWTLEGFALGTADITESDAVYFTRAGVSCEWSLTSAVGLQVVADAPVTAARRSEATVAVDIKVGW